MKIPGQIFQKHLQTDEPVFNGRYLCYIDSVPPLAHESEFPLAEMKIKSFLNGKWINPEKILLWMGPIPVFCLDELREKGIEAEQVLYFTGRLKDKKWKSGPFYSSLDIFPVQGEQGDFAWRYPPGKSIPEPFMKWHKSGRWIKYTPTKMKRRKKPVKISKPLTNYPYFIGNKKQAAKLDFKAGPFDTLDKAFKYVKKAKKGDFIWVISDYEVPFPEWMFVKKWESTPHIKISKIENAVRVLRKKYESRKN